MTDRQRQQRLTDIDRITDKETDRQRQITEGDTDIAATDRQRQNHRQRD